MLKHSGQRHFPLLLKLKEKIQILLLLINDLQQLLYTFQITKLYRT